MRPRAQRARTRRADADGRRTRHRPSVERLEGRVCLSWAEPPGSLLYDFEMLARTGAGDFFTIHPGISINDAGDVAFSAFEDALGEAVYAVPADSASPRLISFPPDDLPPFRNYSNTVAINSDPLNPVVAATDIIALEPGARVRTWDLAGNFDIVESTVGTTDDTYRSEVDLNDNGYVVYLGLDTDFGPFVNMRVSNGARDFHIGSFAANVPLKPQISDTNEVVFRNATGASIVKTIPLTDPTAPPTFFRIAGGPEGFRAGNGLPAVGAAPDISADGGVVVFFGNYDSDNDGTGDSPGIFASILKPGGGRTTRDDRIIVRLAGFANDMGVDETGELVGLSGFYPDERVGIGGEFDGLPNSVSDLYVTFLADTPIDVDKALWQVRLPLYVDGSGGLLAPDLLTPLSQELPTSEQTTWDLRRPNLPLTFKSATRPEYVVSVGDELNGLLIDDIELYDPINARGQIAFVASFNVSEQAIFRTTSATDADRDGLLDVWEDGTTVGPDVDEDGVPDLDFVDLGVDPFRRDIFLELDWVAAENAPLREALQDLANVFANAPSPSWGPGTIAPGITLHIDAGPSLSINMPLGGDHGGQISGGVDYDVIYLGAPGAATPAGTNFRAASLLEIKRANFASGGVADDLERFVRESVFHYAVMADFMSPIRSDASGRVVYRNGEALPALLPEGLFNFTSYDVEDAVGMAVDVAAGTIRPPAIRIRGDLLGPADGLNHEFLKVVAGPGSGQVRRIRSHRYDPATDLTTIEVDYDWEELPSFSSRLVLLSSISGIARPFGADFVVSLREFDPLAGRVGNRVTQAQTLLHELGHNLGLHGDTEAFAHLSAMAYPHQGVGNEEPFDAASNPGGYIADYSRIGAVDLAKSYVAGLQSEWDVLRPDLTSFSGSLSAFGDVGEAFHLEPTLRRILELLHPEDTEQPLILIDRPAEGAAVPPGGALSVRVYADDNVAVASVRVAFDVNGDGDFDDPGEMIDATPAGGILYEATFAGLAGPAGARRLVVTAVDAAGNRIGDDRTLQVGDGGGNLAPVAGDDLAETPEGQAVDIDVLGNDGDPDGELDPASVTIVDGPAHGSVAVDPTTGLITYTPAIGYSGPDSFTYTVKDRAGAVSNVAAVAIDVQVPLRVEEVVVNGGARQRSNVETIAVRFNQGTNLSALIADGSIVDAVEIFGVSRNPGKVTLSASRYRWDDASRTLTIDLTVDSFGGSALTLLGDDDFELRLKADLIRAAALDVALEDSDGVADGVVTSRFHRLAGDFDGNRAVDAADRDAWFDPATVRFGARVGQPGYSIIYDLDGDGVISSRDYYAWLRSLFGRSLP